MDELQNAFCFGMFYGALAAMAVGIILVQIRESRGKMGQWNRPLDGFPDSAHPKMTSFGVAKSSVLSMFSCAFWTFLLLLAIGVIILITSQLINLVS